MKALAARLPRTRRACAALLLALPLLAAQAHGPADYSALFETVSPAVVSVNSVTVRNGSNTPFPFFFFGIPHDPGQGPDSPFRSSGVGSGVIISSDGHVITNAHVILNEDGSVVDNIEVVLHTKERLAAKVVGYDEYSDIALLRVESDTPLPAATIGDSDQIKVGQSVVAIGHPLGLNYTLTAGIISSLNRSLLGGGGSERFVPFIQTDAAINPGNSGGPLLNVNGEVVGINSRIIGGRGGGFIGYSLAIPINLAMEVQAKLRVDGTIRRGMLGVTFNVNGISEDDAKVWGLDPDRGGVIVNSVIEGSGAEAGGILPGDIVLEYDGKAIRDASEFPRSIANTEPGTLVPVLVFREGTEIGLTVTIGSIEDGGQLRASGGGSSVEEPFGMVLSEVPEGQLLSIGQQGGVLLQGFNDQDGSVDIPQEMFKLRRGDVIIGVIISGKLNKVDKPAELRRLLSDLQVDTIGFQVVRGSSRRPFFVTINLSN